MPLTEGRFRIVLAAALVAALLFPSDALAQESAKEKQKVPEPTGITVRGQATVTVTPNIVRVHFGAVGEGTEQGIAEKNSLALRESLIRRVKTAGVSAQDITVSTSASWGSGPARIASRTVPLSAGLTGQQAAQAVHHVSYPFKVTFRQTADLEKTLTMMTGAGAQIEGANFDLSNPVITRDQSLEKAVADAAGKARVMAKAAGLERIHLIAMSEESVNLPQATYRQGDMEIFGSREGRFTLPSLVATAFVTLRYAIEKPQSGGQE